MASKTPIPFTLKYFDQVVASMLNWFASVQQTVTDFNVGSVTRTLFEALGAEQEEFYHRMFRALEQGIPIAIYNGFGFEKFPAQSATGSVTFSRSTPADTDYLIPSGTVVATSDDIRFTTDTDATIAQNTTSVSVTVTAEEPGSQGNVAANTIVEIKGGLLGVESVTNPAALSGGVDEETDEEQKTRFQEFIVGLARSPINGVLAGVKTAQITDSQGNILERVKQASLEEPYLTDPNAIRGLVNVYIDAGSGSASSALITEAQKIVDGYIDSNNQPVVGYRAAGVVVNVQSVSSVLVNVTTSATKEADADATEVQNAINDTISRFFDDIPIGGTLDWERLLSAIVTTAGVVTATLTDPVGDVTSLISQRLRPGTITITVT